MATALLASALVASTIGEALESEPPEDPSAVRVRYEDGVEIETADGNFRFHIDFRAQLRYSKVDGSDNPAANDLLQSSEDFFISGNKDGQASSLFDFGECAEVE